MSSFMSTRRLVLPWSTITASFDEPKFCWNTKFWSTVMKTSNLLGRKGQQFAILGADPSHLPSGLDFMA
jgi:hypothetical protein